MHEKKLYFGPLDSLRVYAFFIVFISHAYFSFFRVTDTRTRVIAHGEVGVHIFFVLSAFLITYLALQEYAKSKSFSILHFFKKRILRIWPLYFIVIGLSYAWHLASAPEQTIGCASMFVYFLGNQCLLVGVPQSIGSSTLIPMWSISIEQQFYTIFPVMLYAAILARKKKAMRYVVAGSLTAILAIALMARYAHAGEWGYISYATISSVPGFVFGMALAYLLFKNSTIISHIRKHRTGYSITALAAFVLTFVVKFMGALGVALYIVPVIYATSVYIILGTDPSKKGETKKSPLQYLGQVSYGLYAYHMFAIVILQHLDWPIGPVGQSLSALVMTILMAHFSYRYIERWFLSFK
jgi:peptidoglycan/LPS O-acetylase OafA/YrhL